MAVLTAKFLIEIVLVLDADVATAGHPNVAKLLCASF